MTSLSVDELPQVVPPVEAAFQAHMARWRLDGKLRTARRDTTDKHCPRPTPEERLLCILGYLKTYPLQVVQGRRFGMGQRKAHQWMHVLLLVQRATLRALGDAPTRSLTELAPRLGGTEAEAAAMGEPTGGPAPASPRLGTRGANGASSVPRIRRSRRAGRAARKNTIR